MKNPWVITIFIAIALFGGSFWYASLSAERNNAGVEIQPYVKGNPEAQVTLVKYSDFSCPACADAAFVVQDVMEQYGDVVSFEYRHFPFITPASARAAVAAEAAGQQGKFYEFHDLLFANQSAWSRSSNPTALFLEYADTLELDLDTFRRHLNSTMLRDHTMEDMAAGRAAGITGTPTFFLNGERMEFRSFEEFVDQVSAAATGTPATESATPANSNVRFGI
jgi:protein-disulfide isomerase